jgi:hypothetical protein
MNPSVNFKAASQKRATSVAIVKVVSWIRVITLVAIMKSVSSMRAGVSVAFVKGL